MIPNKKQGREKKREEKMEGDTQFQEMLGGHKTAQGMPKVRVDLMKLGAEERRREIFLRELAYVLLF